jgi:hypothetical protein
MNMTASKNIIPVEITSLSQRFQTERRATAATVQAFEPSEFLHAADASFPYFRDERENLIIEICEAVAAQPLVTIMHGDVVVRETSTQTAESVYLSHARRHAYEGTLILALLQSLRDVLSWAQFVQYRARLRTRKGRDRVFWELARHSGRPSVPSHVLPVFAIYEAEKASGKPLPDLTTAQLEYLGLV